MEIPKSDVARPESLEARLEELRDRLGIPVDAPTSDVELEPFMGHEEWEQQRPDELAQAQALEQARAHRFALERGTLEGWAPRRAFPCPGTLRIEDQSGLVWPVVCDVCGYEVGVQVQKIDPERLQEHRLAKAGVPAMFAGKRFAANEHQEVTLSACRQWIRGFRREAVPAVALWGKAGRGKSHLLSLMVETLVKTYATDALYRSWIELFDELAQGFDHSTYEAQWRRVLNVPLLALDDVGAGRTTDWRRERFAALVDYRYARELPLIIATNIPPAGWEREFGSRTSSRLRGIVLPFVLEGPDWRAQGVQEQMAVASP